jgi:hypothetical protein
MLLTMPALPVLAETNEERPPEAVVAEFEAALDAHDAARANQLISDSTALVGMDTYSGREQVEWWIQQQIDNAVSIEVGPLHVNGNRVSWTARVSRTDWIRSGMKSRYIDQEAAVAGNVITVLGAHVRSPEQAPASASSFVRAQTLAAAYEGEAPSKTEGWFGVVAVLASGLLTGVYAASGWSPPGAQASLQKGRLVPALARAVATRRSRG